MRPSPSISRLLALICAIIFCALSTQRAYAVSPIHVKPNGNGGNSGAAWNTATTLQHALATASAGNEIWVATGIYTPGITISDTFALPAGVAVYGGFAATETLLTQRDWVANPTILSGDIGGDDGTDAGGIVTDTVQIIGANSYHVVTADGSLTPITGTTRLDGFAITAGDAAGATFPKNAGGGFYCHGNEGLCSPHLERLIFSGNSAIRYGGAIYNAGFSGGASSPTLVNVTFSGNSSSYEGGAIYNDGYDLGNSSPSLVNVTFAGNSAQYGGAMFNGGETNGHSKPSLVNVTFSSNSAKNGGAMFNEGFDNGESSPSLVNVTFAGNSASQSGGAISSEGFSSGASFSRFVNTIFWGNIATTDGAQIYNTSASAVFTTSLVQGGITGTGVVNVSSIVTNGGGNLDADPLFVDAIHGNLRLNAASPAVDAGANSAITQTTDLDGNPRKIDGDTNGTAIVDMGAYEFLVNQPLTVTLAGNGSGQIDRTPAGNSCTAPCSATYAVGTSVILTATAGTHSSFSGWSGGCIGSTPCHLSMDAAKHVIATFTLNAYPLTIHTVGNGSVAKQPNQATYLFGTAVTLTASANPGSTFAGWSGDCTGAGSPPGACPLTINAAKDVIATFTKNSYPLTVHKAGNGSGTVQPNQGNFLFGTVVTLTATAATSSTFSGWSGDCIGAIGAAPCHLTIDTSNGVTATFTLNPVSGNHTPSFTSTAGLTVTVGVPYSYIVTASDLDSGDILTLSAPIKPTWLTLTPTGNGAATLAGTPGSANVGANAVQLRVQDQVGAFATQNFTITVAAANPNTTGSVQGKVQDEQNKALAGATLTLSNESGEAAAATLLTQTTDNSGNYLFEGAPAGNYTLTASLAGYDSSAPKTVTVQAGQTTTVATLTLLTSKALLHLPLLDRAAIANCTQVTVTSENDSHLCAPIHLSAVTTSLA